MARKSQWKYFLVEITRYNTKLLHRSAQICKHFYVIDFETKVLIVCKWLLVTTNKQKYNYRILDTLSSYRGDHHPVWLQIQLMMQFLFLHLWIIKKSQTSAFISFWHCSSFYWFLERSQPLQTMDVFGAKSIKVKGKRH